MTDEVEIQDVEDFNIFETALPDEEFWKELEECIQGTDACA